MKKPIRIVQYGIRHEHALGVIASLRSLPDEFEIVGAVDDVSCRTNSFRDGSDRETYYSDLNWMTEEDLFARSDIDAVAVEVPNLDLVPVAMRCAEHGLAVHMDKPGSLDPESFRTMRFEFEKRNLAFQIGYMYRANPAMRWIRRAAASGWLGDIFEVRTGMNHNYGGEFYQKYLSGFPGGIMFNLGCHPIDFLVSLLGRPSGVTPFLSSVAGEACETENNCLAVLEYPHAIAAVEACSRELDGVEERRLKVCGTKGTVDLRPVEVFDGRALKMELHLKESCGEYSAGRSTIDFGILRDRYTDHLREFAAILRGEIANPYDAAHDCLVHELTLAASGILKWRDLK